LRRKSTAADERVVDKELRRDNSYARTANLATNYFAARQFAK
jgi:hypothetical protein